MLEAVARQEDAEPMLVRIVTSSWEAKRLLALPADVHACVFDLEGVLTASARLHSEAWRETFDGFLAGRSARDGGRLAHFDVRVDYPRLIHGRPRLEGVTDFLASRGISLPVGSPDDPPDVETVHGLANRKRRALLRLLEEHPVTAYRGARLYLELAHDCAVRCAVVSASATTARILERAGMDDLVDACVDGTTMGREGLAGAATVDTLLVACRELGVPPEHAAVFETTADGVAAGRAAGFERVIGVHGHGNPAALAEQGADTVAADLGELLARTLGA